MVLYGAETYEKRGLIGYVPQKLKHKVLVNLWILIFVARYQVTPLFHKSLIGFEKCFTNIHLLYSTLLIKIWVHYIDKIISYILIY